MYNENLQRWLNFFKDKVIGAKVTPVLNRILSRELGEGGYEDQKGRQYEVSQNQIWRED